MSSETHVTNTRSTDAETFLISRPILAYQLDATHLQAVLNHLCRQTDMLSTDARLRREKDTVIERALLEVSDRVARIEAALENLGGAAELRALRGQVNDVSRVVDGLTAQVLPEMQRRLQESQTAVDRAVKNAVEPVERRAIELVENAKREMQAEIDAQRQTSRELKLDRERQEQQFLARGSAHTQKLQDDVANLERRVDHVERNVCNPMRDLIDEMQSTTNNNFTQIGQATQLFDSEIRKLKSEMTNLRSEVNRFDTDATNSINKIKEDIDTKFELLRQMMQSFERNNQLFEQAVSDAGARMAAARQMAANAGLQQFAANKPGAALTPSSTSGFR